MGYYGTLQRRSRADSTGRYDLEFAALVSSRAGVLFGVLESALVRVQVPYILSSPRTAFRESPHALMVGVGSLSRKY